MAEFMTALPYHIVSAVFPNMTSPFAFVYSSVPGPAAPLDWGVVKITKVTPIGPPVGRCGNTMIVLSLNNNVGISLMTSAGFIDKPDEFMAIFESKF